MVFMRIMVGNKTLKNNPTCLLTGIVDKSTIALSIK